MNSKNHAKLKTCAFEYDQDGHPKAIAVNLEDPATLLESLDEVDTEDEECEEEPVDHKGREIVHRFFRLCAVRSDGKLHTPVGMALRLCCLASLLKVYPMDGMPFQDIARHCGLTRAAVSKIMLELSEITGIRSRQQRTNSARRAYSRRAYAVHRRRERKTATPEEVTGYGFPRPQEKAERGLSQ